MQDIKFERAWCMPNHNTFSMKPIGEFVNRYLAKSRVSIDPFARDTGLATYTNDLNPDTTADYHMDAVEFLEHLQSKGVKADLLIVDPPWSPRQISECYKGIGLEVTQKTTQIGTLYRKVRDAALPLLTDDAVVLHFGWNSTGMGKGRGFKIDELLLVNHGGPHTDTICMAETRAKK